MAKRKNKKNENETKKRVWLIVNFAMIMIFGVFIAIRSEVIGIAYVANESIVDSNADVAVFNLTKDIIIEANKVLNKSIGITVGIYALIQLINYVAHLFKMKKGLIVLILLEVVAAVSGIITNGELIMFAVPVLSALIYLRILKLEES